MSIVATPLSKGGNNPPLFAIMSPSPSTISRTSSGYLLSPTLGPGASPAVSPQIRTHGGLAAGGGHGGVGVGASGSKRQPRSSSNSSSTSSLGGVVAAAHDHALDKGKGRASLTDDTVEVMLDVERPAIGHHQPHRPSFTQSPVSYERENKGFKVVSRPTSLIQGSASAAAAAASSSSPPTTSTHVQLAAHQSTSEPQSPYLARRTSRKSSASSSSSSQQGSAVAGSSRTVLPASGRSRPSILTNHVASSPAVPMLNSASSTIVAGTGGNDSSGVVRRESWKDRFKSSLHLRSESSSRMASGSSSPSRTKTREEPSSLTTTAPSIVHEDPEASYPAAAEDDVVETDEINVTRHSSGRKMINQYIILQEIGRGQHGQVRLGEEEIPGEPGQLWAIKIVDRQAKKKLPGFKRGMLPPPPPPSSSEQVIANDKLKREIAILKKCRHPNVVRLREVIDSPQSKKIYLILEYCEGGEVKWQSATGEPLLTVEQSRRIFRDIVCGLEYLHHQGIIHRDIKPANLLYAKDGTIKISDFGVSHYSHALRGSDGEDEPTYLDEHELAKTAGSPAFFAPELCYGGTDTPPTGDHPEFKFRVVDDAGSRLSVASTGSRPESPGSILFRKNRPPITQAIDVWALGVTLYCFLFGRVPFDSASEYALFNIIPREDYEVPETMGADRTRDEDALDLLRQLLTKDPLKRISLDEVKRHPFVLRGIADKNAWLARTDPAVGTFVTVSNDEVAAAVTNSGSFRDRVRKTMASIKKSFGRSQEPSSPRPGLSRKISTLGRSRSPAGNVSPDLPVPIRRQSAQLVRDMPPPPPPQQPKSLSASNSTDELTQRPRAESNASSKFGLRSIISRGWSQKSSTSRPRTSEGSVGSVESVREKRSVETMSNPPPPADCDWEGSISDDDEVDYGQPVFDRTPGEGDTLAHGNWRLDSNGWKGEALGLSIPGLEPPAEISDDTPIAERKSVFADPPRSPSRRPPVSPIRLASPRRPTFDDDDDEEEEDQGLDIDIGRRGRRASKPLTPATDLRSLAP